jgi:hypothetical protein
MRFLVGFICGALSICGVMAFAVVLVNKFADVKVTAVKIEPDEDWEDK